MQSAVFGNYNLRARNVTKNAAVKCSDSTYEIYNSRHNVHPKMWFKRGVFQNGFSDSYPPYSREQKVFETIIFYLITIKNYYKSLFRELIHPPPLELPQSSTILLVQL